MGASSVVVSVFVGFLIVCLGLGLTLPFPLSYPLYSLVLTPCLSPTRLGQHGLGFPFISFSNCGYKIKRLLGFVPMFFFLSGATIYLHSL
jgi:hypothetical protein